MEFSKFSYFVLLFTIIWAMACSCLANDGSFDENYEVAYGDSHITRIDQGKGIELSIDLSSGAGFKSKQNYLSGFFQMRIKLPPKSDGVVTAFYLATGVDQGSEHEEVDFEFLGDKIVQTNVFVRGVGNKEERFNFWFDPTADFHTYRVLWNPFLLVFFVDDTPIRMVKNNQQQGIPFPQQPMHIQVTLWNATWAGGPTNWTIGPFKAQFEGFDISGCPSSTGPEGCASPSLEWNSVHELNPTQMEAYKSARNNYMFYNYCSDPSRRPTNPKECEIQQ